MMVIVKHKPGKRMPSIVVAFLFFCLITAGKLLFAKGVKIRVFFSPHLSGYDLPSSEQADWNKLGGTSTFPWRRKKTKTGHQNSHEHLAVWRYYNHQFQVSSHYRRLDTDLQVPTQDQVKILSQQGLGRFYSDDIILPLSHGYPAIPWFGGTLPVPEQNAVIYFIRFTGLTYKV